MSRYVRISRRGGFALAALLLLPVGLAFGHDFFDRDPFRQLDEVLPTPNAYRTASGAPGHAYWQQRADYVIGVRLDEREQRIVGHERIHYENHSPDVLTYLWVQLDQNSLRPDAPGRMAGQAPNMGEKQSFRRLASALAREEFEGGYEIESVRDAEGADLEHVIVETMMRIDLPTPLVSGATTDFEIEWSYTINENRKVGSRTGYEVFEDGHAIYEIAHWYPRMAAYTDNRGWQHKQFLGSGEFTLEIGDFEVAITVPADHVVGATGVLQNPDEVLGATQRKRLQQARSAEEPVFIVDAAEARENARQGTRDEKTWVFRAESVRDFAFASSRRFLWDAWGVPSGDKVVLAQSLYPPEAEPLWSKYSTHAIAHTIEVYSRYTFEFPYPEAISVNGPVGGMEYPMICFNGPRPLPDKTWFGDTSGMERSARRRSKYGLISVVIHEVGHNYFPMIVNSDERQWTWMDEGLNTFLQSIAQREWEDDYPVGRGEPASVAEYMTSDRQVPIMTNSESLLQFHNNAYAKPAVALNVLRETILGHELFDFAFAEFARRWQFKRPQPADFFRSMEDASGVDLDWFWRGWFYTTDHVDIAVRGVEQFRMASLDPRDEAKHEKAERERRREEDPTRGELSFRDLEKYDDRYPSVRDFYKTYDPLDASETEVEDFEELLDELEPWQRDLLDTDEIFQVIEFENIGGLAMPILLEIEFEDGRIEALRIPAEIWRHGDRVVRKMVIDRREIVRVTVDPHAETADAEVANNSWPPSPKKSRFEVFREKDPPKNPMQEAGLGEEEGQ